METINDLPIILNVRDVAAVLRISTQRAYAIMQISDFPKIKIGKRVLVNRDSFFQWLENQK
ncbi:helix-turn-helix domain-containing protein [Gottfriedia acidiceleris]|uniref:helix-turn-helix domain-containing protein n=1 Tax=Gottfriedia acidiceleris TaxID=371036 RepID=UPI002F267BDD